MKSIFKSPFSTLIFLLVLIGTFLHFAPFLTYQRLVYSISEDGYYMLTIARNIASGYGMSIADGTIPTNGTQPLMTYLMSLIFLLAGGNKIISIVIIVIIQWIIAAVTYCLIYKTGLKLFKNNPEGKKISLLAAAVWYASPLMIRHTMNGLESGLYALAVLYVISFLIFCDNPFSTRNSVLTGLMLGVTFLIRNDAVFLVALVCFILLMPGLYQPGIQFSKRFAGVIIIGFTSLIIASPWLIYNQINFGWIMPISAQAEMLGEKIGGNFVNLPRILSEYFLVFIPLSYGAQKYLPVLLSWIVFVIIVAVFIIIVYKKFDIHQKRITLISGIFLFLLSTFYSTVFDHYYFLPRYIFPVTTVIALGWSAAVYYGLKKYEAKFKNMIPVSGVIFAVLILIFAWVRYMDTNKHMHFQVVNWVKENVDDNVWISAFQSGAVGYFHDKTINLDGKVNPEAIKARRTNSIPQYMVNSRAEYMADWADRILWMKDSTISKNFEVIICDSLKDLVVLKKKSRK